MQRDDAVSVAKATLLAYLTALLFWGMVNLSGVYLSLPVCLTLSLPPALLIGVWAWNHRRIRHLERQVDWLIRRLNEPHQGES